MRNAILQMPETRTAKEQRQVIRAAIRQLDRADIYLAAITYMQLDDREARRAVNLLRTNLEGLRLYLGERRERVED